MEIVLSARGGVLRGIDFDDLRPTTPWTVTSEESEFTSQNPGALPTKRLQTGGGQIGNDRSEYRKWSEYQCADEICQGSMGDRTGSA